MHDRVPPDRDILPLANHVELVNDFLIHEAQWFPGQELKGSYELLRGDVLLNHQLAYIYRIRSEEAGLGDLLLLAKLEEVLKATARVHLTVPKLHARHDVTKVCKCESIRVALAHTQEVSVHLTRHVIFCHWQLSVFEQFDLVGLDDVFGDHARPLVLDTYLTLLVAKIVVAAEDLDQLLVDVRESLLDDGTLVRVEIGQVVALDLHRLVLVLPIAL